MNIRCHIQLPVVLFASLLAVALLTVDSHIRAGDFGCARCGCANACQKTCRLVCEEKKVQITCWGCKSEDFCVPGPSKRGCKHCDTVCDEDNADGPCVQPKTFSWFDWIPGCASIHTKQKLMKKTVTKTVPSYKWVVEDLCHQCQDKVSSVTPPPGTEVPPPPPAVVVK